MSSKEEIAELISRRRRQILVHSVIYYKMNDSIISDYTWSVWAKELYDLQNNHPDIARYCPYADVFKDFDPSTGYNLPLDDDWAVSTAKRLLKDRNRRGS